jgi:hypothetical protein
MSLKCVLPTCSSNANTKTLFRFPEANPQLLESWKIEIPTLDFDQLNLSEVWICEDHFSGDQIKVGRNSKRELIRDAVPELSKCVDAIDLDSCRFCLSGRELVQLTRRIRECFEDLLQEQVFMLIF